MNAAGFWILALIAFVVLAFFTVAFMASRYKRCPSDKILVIYGRVDRGRSSRTMHGGGACVWPLIQDYAYISLTPITINIPLENALSLQNIRINVPSTFTVGVSTAPEIMSNAAERILHLQQTAIEEMAKEIIFGQLRLTVASLTIEQINQDRESFLDSIRRNVEPELNKIGLQLINVNITDITDASEYISSIGKKAAAEAAAASIQLPQELPPAPPVGQDSAAATPLVGPDGTVLDPIGEIISADPSIAPLTAEEDPAALGTDETAIEEVPAPQPRRRKRARPDDWKKGYGIFGGG